MNLQKIIASFDPNQPGEADANIFGLPFSPADARLVIVPVPWEVTVSYGGGTINGPEAIFEASKQVDLYDPDFADAWKLGVAMQPVPAKLKTLSRKLRKKAQSVIARIEQGDDPVKIPSLQKARAEIDRGCRDMIQHVEESTAELLKQGKMIALIGGDHSTPLGFMKALARQHKSFGILQVDAHADLRDSYEGFEFSHASIMFNALKIPQVTRLVQAGIRDYCEDEVAVIRNSRGRVRTFFDRDIKRARYAGRTVDSIQRDIVRQLPRDVYVSFDIDGLDPKLCPHTGTPVPGGFEFEEAVSLIRQVVASGRRIIGLDINEVSPRDDEWDANVGARLLFRLINVMAKSHGFKSGNARRVK